VYSDTIAPLDGNAPSFAFVDLSGTGTPLFLSDDLRGRTTADAVIHDSQGSAVRRRRRSRALRVLVPCG